MHVASEGVITFNRNSSELFVRSPLDRRNPWMLVKSLLLTDKTTKFNGVFDECICYHDQEYKDRVIKVETMMFDAYLADKGRTGLVKLLGKLAKGDIHSNWLRTQFERLADNNEDFDFSENWKILCLNKQGEEDVYQLLYLFRLLWNGLSRHS